MNDLDNLVKDLTKDNELDKKILSKKTTKAPKKIITEINQMKENVDTHLGEYKDRYICITTEDQLDNYISDCINNGIVAIDTETTGLDAMLDDIVGFSLYTPGCKAIYVPINHINYENNEKLPNQLSKEQCKKHLDRLNTSNVKVIMFNANFDLRVFRHQLGVDLNIWWDSYIAQRCLNENEKENNLKYLHNKYILKGQKDVFRFSDLFEKGKFNIVPIEAAYIYAARDAEITYELYEYQKQFLDITSQKCIDKDLTRVAYVFREIEMPLIKIVANMEDTGVKVDLDYLNELSEKYNKLLLEKEAEFYKLCDKYNDKIEAYRKANPDNKLSSMININSPTQLAILIYDILREQSVPKQPARGTGEEVLKAINNEFCKVILEYREVAKLIGTYIDKMRNIIHKDGKVHCIYNQYGADTGRFSSKNPNMQNIPSHSKDIRQMFIASQEEQNLQFEDKIRLYKYDDIMTSVGWKQIKDLTKNDIILDNIKQYSIKNIEKDIEDERYIWLYL